MWLSLWLPLWLGWSHPAWALCPNCLGQTRSLTPTLELLGGFLLIPFVVAYLALWRIRRVCRDVPQFEPPPSTALNARMSRAAGGSNVGPAG